MGISLRTDARSEWRVYVKPFVHRALTCRKHSGGARKLCCPTRQPLATRAPGPLTHGRSQQRRAASGRHTPGSRGSVWKKKVPCLIHIFFFYTDYILKQHFCTYWVKAELISSASLKNVASGKCEVSCVAHIQFLGRVRRWNAPFFNGKLSEACLPVMSTPWTWSVSGPQHKGGTSGKESNPWFDK